MIETVGPGGQVVRVTIWQPTGSNQTLMSWHEGVPEAAVTQAVRVGQALAMSFDVSTPLLVEAVKKRPRRYIETGEDE